jgi:hypothetical protein
MQPIELFDTAFDASRQALKSSGAILEKNFRIAGLPVRIRFAGPAMQDNVLPALSHLEVSESDMSPGLVVNIWDCESSGVKAPFPPELWNACTPWGELTATRNSTVHASRLMDVGVYSMLDLAGGRAVYWAHRADQVPPYARAAPLRSLLHIWMRAHKRIFLHGASVAVDGESILLAGKAGSGKSTTALLCALAGWQYLGDDYCAASVDGRPRTHSLFNSAKLSPDQWSRFAHWTRSPHAVKDPQSGKAVVFLGYDTTARVIPEGNLRAVVLPAITGNARSTIEPDSAAAAWKAMAPSTVLQLPGAGAPDLAAIAGLARSVPCFRLLLGSDWERIPSVIAEGLAMEQHGK